MADCLTIACSDWSSSKTWSISIFSRCLSISAFLLILVHMYYIKKIMDSFNCTSGFPCRAKFWHWIRLLCTIPMMLVSNTFDFFLFLRVTLQDSSIRSAAFLLTWCGDPMGSLKFLNYSTGSSSNCESSFLVILQRNITSLARKSRYWEPTGFLMSGIIIIRDSGFFTMHAM